MSTKHSNGVPNNERIMDRSAKALESFCEGDEAWEGSWKVSAVGRGWDAAMPGFSSETVGLTDRRLLWLDENLETVELTDVEAVSTDTVEHGNAPGVVRAGALALVLGAIGSAVLFLLFSAGLRTAILPLTGGTLLFVGSIGVARAREETGARLMQHRLQIETAESVVTVWGDQEDVQALADALDSES